MSKYALAYAIITIIQIHSSCNGQVIFRDSNHMLSTVSVDCRVITNWTLRTNKYIISNFDLHLTINEVF